MGNHLSARKILQFFPPLDLFVRTQLYKYENSSFPRDFANSQDKNQEILNQLLRDGYYVFPDYYDAEWCDTSREMIKKVLAEHPEYVQRREDERLFAVENISDHIARFYKDPFLKALSDTYYGAPSAISFSMANRIVHNPGQDLGSGGDWHRDGMKRQFKSIVYLKDVEEKDGPFQYVQSSNLYNTHQFYKDTKITGIPEQVHRLSAERVKPLTERYPERLVTFTARKGTVILADTSGIHRGSPVAAGGERYAIFNYYYPEAEIDWDEVNKKWGKQVPKDFQFKG